MDTVQREVIKLTHRMNEAGFPHRWVEMVRSMVDELGSLGVTGIPSWLSELLRAVPDQEQYCDIWAQGWFAWVFVKNGLRVLMNPARKRGPDLKLQNQDSDIYVEVRRFRPDYEQERALRQAGKGGALVAYGDFDADLRKILDGVIEKSRQGRSVPPGAAYLVALQSSKESIDEITFELACHSLEEEAIAGGSRYALISGLFFDDGYQSVRTGQRWYFWENPNADSGRRFSGDVVSRLPNLRVPYS